MPVTLAAIGAVRAFEEAGLRVGRDVALVVGGNKLVVRSSGGAGVRPSADLPGAARS